MDGSLGGALSTCKKSHYKLITIEVYSICCDFSQKSGMETQI